MKSFQKVFNNLKHIRDVTTNHKLDTIKEIDSYQ